MFDKDNLEHTSQSTSICKAKACLIMFITHVTVQYPLVWLAEGIATKFGF